MNNFKNTPPVPLYYTLVEFLKKQIEDEDLKPGETIPSERELIEKFNLSRTTVRKAIDILVNEGLLAKVQGKGTFVQKKRMDDGLIKLTSCTESIRKMGLTPGRKLLNASIEPARKSVAINMHIDPEEKVFKLNRVLYGDNIPVNVTKSNVIYKHVNGIEKYDFEKESLYNIMETKFNIKITHSVRTIEAILANERDAELLQINEGSPILLFNGLVYGIVNGEEKPIEYFVSKYRCDISKFYIEQVR